jgi:bifunctional non-homologous end joining protein LigD
LSSVSPSKSGVFDPSLQSGALCVTLPLGKHVGPSPASWRDPPRSTHFGSPLVLSGVHWVEPKLGCEITYLTWTADNLLRHTVYVWLREDKPATEVRREIAGDR